MSRESTLILLGIITVLLPFVGLPHTWLYVLYPLVGVAIAIIGFALRNGRVPREKQLS